MRLAIGEVGILVGLSTRGTIGTAVLVVGVTVLAYVVLLSLHVLTLRLEVETDELHVVSWLTRRRYRLRAGRVLRLAVDARRGVFGTQLGGLGIEIGQGRTMSGDVLDVIRLAPNAVVLVVAAVPRPIGVAPASPRALLRALELHSTAQQIGATDAADQPLAVDPSR